MRKTSLFPHARERCEQATSEHSNHGTMKMPQTPITDRLVNATDDFISEALPGWLKQATPVDIERLRTRFSSHLTSQQAMQAVLSRIPDLKAFAESGLSKAFFQRLNLQPAFADTIWRDMRLRFKTSMGGSLPSGEMYPREQPLLQRLLQNFRDNATFFDESGLVRRSDSVLFYDKPEKITALVRELDLGKAYQRELDQVLGPVTKTALAVDKRTALGVACEMAWLKGQLEKDDAQWIRGFVDGRPLAHASGGDMRVCALTLLNCRVQDAMVFELRGSKNATLESVILYLPDAPTSSLQCFASLSALTDALGLRIRQQAWRDYFVGCISLKDRVGFLGTLAKRLGDPATDLQPRTVQISDGFDDLARWQVQRIKDDARLLAVPTADVDEKASQARLDAWETVGMGLLNLAGLFVPAIGGALMAGWLVQTLGEVYEGALDWSQGHRHEALEHMLGVAENVAVTALLATGVTIAARGFERSSFVEGLVPVSTGTGSLRLWSEDLAPYRVEPPEGTTTDTDGLSVEGTRRLWRHAGYWHEVRYDEQQGWHVAHPRRAGAYGPALDFNGERAWRLRSERPLEWQGSAALLARLWPPAEQLAPARVDQILKVTGVDEALLRGLLVENRPLPVDLRDTLERFATEARIEAFLTALKQPGASPDSTLLAWCADAQGLQDVASVQTRQTIYDQAWQWRGRLLDELASAYQAHDPLAETLRRDFPGLPSVDALDLVRHTDERLRLQMQESRRVPLTLAEQARERLQQARVRLMLEGLYLRSSTHDLSVKLLFALLERHANWPAAIRLEFRDGAATGRLIASLPLASSEGATYILVRDEARIDLYDSRGLISDLAVVEPQGLFETLHAVLPQANRQALNWAGVDGLVKMREDIQRWAPSDRRSLMSMVDMRPIGSGFNPAHRLAGGRIGYPLSGRGAGQVPARTVRDRVRVLYQGFTEEQVDEYIEIMGERHGDAVLLNVVAQQEQQLQRLSTALENWTNAVVELPVRAARQQFAAHLLRCWRLQGDIRVDERGNNSGMILSVVGLPVQALPELPEGTEFTHVSELVLVSLGLESIPASFLRCFSEVRWLNLSNNRLLDLPVGLAHVANLREVRLRHNRIRMTATSASLLGDQRHMRVLDLSDNPLGAVNLTFRQLCPLRELNLRGCRLTRVPVGLEWCGLLEFVDLRGNAILDVPDDILQAPFAFRQRLMLQGNPMPRVLFEQLARPAPVVVRPEPAAPGVLGWLRGMDDEEVQVRELRWQRVQAEAGSDNFFSVIDELTGTTDFRSARSDLRRRVWEVIDAIEQDARLRHEVFELAGSPRTCVDSVINVFSTLEVRVFIANALRAEPTLTSGEIRLRLARQLFRLDQVERYARQDIIQRRAAARDADEAAGEDNDEAEDGGVDEIEVSLAYRVGLAQILDLPGQPRTMQFETIAQVNQDDLDAAEAAVRQAQASDQLAQYVSGRDFWREYLEQASADAFDAAGQPFWTRLEALEQQRETLGDGQYREQMNQLRDERDTALNQLALRLTREALEANPDL